MLVSLILKAFDSVEHWVIEQTMLQMGFDKNFIKFISSLNHDIHIITEFGTTNSFPTTRGVKQGCPFSPLLFIIFIEPLLKHISENKTEGYTMECNNLINIPILAFADDLVITANNYRDLRSLLDLLENYCEHYGLKIGKKSAYTYRGKADCKHPMHKPPTLSGNIIDYVPQDMHYKYLGIHISLNLTWDFHFEYIRKKYNYTLSVINNANIDPRLKVRCINTISNTIIAYSMSAIHLSDNDIIKLETQSKRIVKQSMRISARASSHKLWTSTKMGGLNLKRLTHLHSEVIISDLLNILNFTPPKSLVHITTLARMIVVFTANKTDITNNKPIKYMRKTINGRALQLLYKHKVVLNDINPLPLPITLFDLASKINASNELINVFTKLKRCNVYTLNNISHNGKLLSYSDIKNATNTKGFYRPHWNSLHRELCIFNSTELLPIIIENEDNNSWIARRKQALINTERSAERTEIDLYTDGSYKLSEDRAGSGVWSSNSQLSFRTYGKQTIYNAELQAIVAALLLIAPNSNATIYSDSQNSLDFIGKYDTWDTKEWAAAPHYLIQKLIIDLLLFNL